MNMKFRLLSLAALSLVAVAACGTAAGPPSNSPDGAKNMHGMKGMSDMHPSCPMMVKGTMVTAADTADGAALVFTTTGDVAALRTKVAAMAEKHSAMHAGGKVMAMMPSSRARAEDIDRGARLVLTPEAAADVAAIRAHVHKHAQEAKPGECPMMKMASTTH